LSWVGFNRGGSAISELRVLFRGNAGRQRESGGRPAVWNGTAWLHDLAAQFPTLEVRLGGEPEIGVSALPPLRTADWESPDFPFYNFDMQINALAERAEGQPFALTLSGDDRRLPAAAHEVLTRCQRFLERRNRASGVPVFDRVLERHRALHDLGKPLVRADFDHALDTWQWMLRLAPGAGLAVQMAALFHDIERLVTEADVRIEHRAVDYQLFKDDHARRGAEMTEDLLAAAGVGAEMRWRVGRLVAGHERAPAPDDPDASDLALLNDADALSFFSLNSSGYLDYYGPEPTRRKVAYTLARLRPAARQRLRRIRLRPEVAAAVAAAKTLAKIPAASPGPVRRKGLEA
jgi:hypothetical protein